MPIEAHYESSIARNGFHAVVGAMIAAEAGGLWQMCDCGFGRELMMPYRCCYVEGFSRQLLLFASGQSLSMLTLRFGVADSKAGLGFELGCRHESLSQTKPERVANPSFVA